MSRLAALLCIALTFVFAAASIDTADAARFGGGRSFGSRTFMSRPATPPSSFMQQRAAAQRPQAAATAQRPGMGIFGGILAGTLLGSLLFGENGTGGLFNIVIMGGLLYLAFRILSRLRSAGAARRPGQTSPQTAGMSDAQWGPARADTPRWEMLRGDGVSSGPVGGGASSSDRVHVPGEFDTDEFTRGAKAAYARLNASWDRRDLDDIAEFTTADFMAMIRAQAKEDPAPGRTDILLINADLMDVREDGGEQVASVFFNNVLSEDGGPSTDVREVWHFVRSADGSGSWKLDGIQQVRF